MDVLAEAVANEARRAFRAELGNVTSPFIYASFVAAETVDPDLSEVQLADGSSSRFVPKGEHVSGLTIGDTLLCVKGKGVPLTIMMKVVGDITLAEI